MEEHDTAYLEGRTSPDKDTTTVYPPGDFAGNIIDKELLADGSVVGKVRKGWGSAFEGCRGIRNMQFSASVKNTSVFNDPLQPVMQTLKEPDLCGSSSDEAPAELVPVKATEDTSMALTKPPEPAAVTLVEEKPTFVECSWVNPPHTEEGVFPLQLPRFEGNSRTPLAQQKFLLKNLPVIERLLMEGKSSSYMLCSFNVNWIPLAEVLVANKLPTPRDIKAWLRSNKQSTMTLKELYLLGEEVGWRSPFRYAHTTPGKKLEYISVVSMLKNGMTVAQIAKKVGYSTFTVYAFLKKNGIPTPQADRKKQA
jgi:hypothetical protein